MNIVFNCPGCGAILRMKEEYGGKRGRCPHCQGAITVPAIESDAGMDLLPLEGADDKAGKASPEESKTPSGSFSLGSRFAAASRAGGDTKPAPLGGDSNIGLAPLEERPAKGTVAAKPASGESKPRASGGDSAIGLAPLEDQPKPTPALAPKPASKPAPQSGESAIGLAPLDDAKEKAPTTKPAAPSKVSPPTANDDEIALAPLASTAEKSSGVNKGPEAKVAPASVAKTTAASDEPPRLTCNKCGTKMRVPPNAAGRNVTCPKCKNKLRIPAATPPAAKSDSATIALSDTPGSGADLGNDMLDMLGDTGLASNESAAADHPAAALTAAKLSPTKSKGGALLGLPPLAVYGGAAALALVIALGIVYLVGGFAGSGASTQIAQVPAPSIPSPNPQQSNTAPAPAPAATQPAAAQPVATAPAPVTPTPTGPAATSTPPSATSAMPPAPGPSGAAPPTPGGFGLARLRAQADAQGAGQQPAAPSDAPGTGAPSTTPTSAAPGMPAPSPAAADPANWKQRIPVVRSVDAAPRPGEAAAQANQNEQLMLMPDIQGIQTQMSDALKQVSDVESARRTAPAWAELVSKGLEKVQQLRRAGGPPKPQVAEGASLRARAGAMAAANAELETQTQIDAELQRISALPDAMPVLEAALLEQAKRNPQGPLAAALTERGVAVSAAVP